MNAALEKTIQNFISKSVKIIKMNKLFDIFTNELVYHEY